VAKDGDAEAWIAQIISQRVCLIHCTVKYGLGQASHAHLTLSQSSIIWYQWRSKARKVNVGSVWHWPCVSNYVVLYYLWAQTLKTGRWALMAVVALLRV